MSAILGAFVGAILGASVGVILGAFVGAILRGYFECHQLQVLHHSHITWTKHRPSTLLPSLGAIFGCYFLVPYLSAIYRRHLRTSSLGAIFWCHLWARSPGAIFGCHLRASISAPLWLPCRCFINCNRICLFGPTGKMRSRVSHRPM